jgi:UDP-N-acetylglucosamine/UDP-N-acetylgalactosamine diphosphorylase
MDTGSEVDDWSYDEKGNRDRVVALRKAGVVVWGAERVFIGPEVAISRIEPEAILLNAIIRGPKTAIGARSKVGISGTSLLVNSQVGREVELGAGSYRNTTLFDRVKIRGFAEMRNGTVLEEEAEVGHNVGLKHTFLTVGVVAGSCINFCDVLVTGGSSRHDHSEIGSGAIHFNFDPRGDKFGSLFGDARGVLLRGRRIFIGGNAGVIAPVHIGFGAVIAAGSFVRKDVGESRIYLGDSEGHRPKDAIGFDPNLYYDLRRKFVSTAELCGNLHALERWYQRFRVPFATGLERILCESAARNIRAHIEHRAKELDKVIVKLSSVTAEAGANTNPFRSQHLLMGEMRKKIYSLLIQPDERTAALPENFLYEYQRARKSVDHCSAIHGTSEAKSRHVEEWLSAIASQPKTELKRILG